MYVQNNKMYISSCPKKCRNRQDAKKKSLSFDLIDEDEGQLAWPKGAVVQNQTKGPIGKNR